MIQANTAVTKVLPQHTIKAGFSYLWDNHWNDAAQSPQRGSYAFNGRYTTNPKPITGQLSGIAFADFLLGYPNSTGNATPSNYITRNLSSQWGMYVQDDWKLRPNLTLNIGLRYDLQWFEDNPYGNNSLYFPSLQKVVVFGNSYPADCDPGLPEGSRSLCRPKSAYRIMFGTTLGRTRTTSLPVLALPIRLSRIRCCAAPSASTTTSYRLPTRAAPSGPFLS